MTNVLKSFSNKLIKPFEKELMWSTTTGNSSIFSMCDIHREFVDGIIMLSKGLFLKEPSQVVARHLIWDISKCNVFGIFSATQGNYFGWHCKSVKTSAIRELASTGSLIRNPVAETLILTVESNSIKTVTLNRMTSSWMLTLAIKYTSWLLQNWIYWRVL